jgi:hypothetical protein
MEEENDRRHTGSTREKSVALSISATSLVLAIVTSGAALINSIATHFSSIDSNITVLTTSVDRLEQSDLRFNEELRMLGKTAAELHEIDRDTSERLLLCGCSPDNRGQTINKKPK